MTSPKISLYDKNSIGRLPWPVNRWSREARKILEPFVRLGPEHFMDNARTQMLALLVDDMVLPVTVSENSDNNSYVCSPYCHYVTYGLEEIKSIKNTPLRLLLKGILHVLGTILSSCSIDKNVIVNNWLLPTNLYPELDERQIRGITETLTTRFHDHAVLFRSINEKYPPALFSCLDHLGYSFVLAREVYFTDTDEDLPFKSRMFKSDLKVLSNTPYRTVEKMTELEKAVPRITELYKALNIEKYSACNPIYNENFIKLALDTGWLRLKAFEHQDKIDAVVGYFSDGHTMTSPLFGYDLSLPTETGLYRLISTRLLLDAKEKKMLLHQSSGAGGYKKLRRAQGVMEYTAFYTRHLGLKRRISWLFLQKLINSFGKGFMKNKN